MTKMDSLKPERRPWTARELGLLIAIVVLAVALFLERNARRDGDRETAADAGLSSDRVMKMVIDHGASDADWKLEQGKRLDHLESRVLDLEHDTRQKPGGR